MMNLYMIKFKKHVINRAQDNMYFDVNDTINPIFNVVQ